MTLHLKTRRPSCSCKARGNWRHEKGWDENCNWGRLSNLKMARNFKLLGQCILMPKNPTIQALLKQLCDFQNSRPVRPTSARIRIAPLQPFLSEKNIRIHDVEFGWLGKCQLASKNAPLVSWKSVGNPSQHAQGMHVQSMVAWIQGNAGALRTHVKTLESLEPQWACHHIFPLSNRSPKMPDLDKYVFLSFALLGLINSKMRSALNERKYGQIWL